MAQGFSIPLPQRLFDSNGAPADSWTVSYVVAGTSTPVTTYSNPALTSANADPVVCDSSGYFRAFVAETVIVDITVKNAAGVSQFTLESVEAMPDTSGTSPSVTAVPTGGMVFYGAAAAPTGFLLCNGSLVNRTTEATLFGVIGTTYGVGDGSTTFGLPDMRGAFPLGKAASGTGNTLGATGGSLDHTHTGPSHTHASVIPRDGWGSGVETPPTTGRIRVGNATGTGADATGYFAANTQSVTSAAGGTGNTGAANPPYVVGNWIIKT